MSHLALSGEDGGDERCVGMTSLTEVAGNGLHVIRRAAVRGDKLAALVFQEQPGGGSVGTGKACAARVEDTDAADDTIRGVVSVAADHDIGTDPGEQRSELLVRDDGIYAGSVVGSGRRVNPQNVGSARQSQAQLLRKSSQDIEQPGLVQYAASPGAPCCHRSVAFHQVGTPGCFRSGCVRGGLIASQDIAVGVPPQHADAGKAEQEFQHLGGSRAEQHQIAEGPPAVDFQAFSVLQDCAQRNVVAVDVSNDPELHVSKCRASGEATVLTFWW